MGRVAADFADRVIVTDDNPRTEDAAAIRADVLAGVPDAVELGGRRQALAAAIAQAGARDVVLIAGQGHDKGQILCPRALPRDRVRVGEPKSRGAGTEVYGSRSCGGEGSSNKKKH